MAKTNNALYISKVYRIVGMYNNEKVVIASTIFQKEVARISANAFAKKYPEVTGIEVEEYNKLDMAVS